MHLPNSLHLFAWINPTRPCWMFSVNRQMLACLTYVLKTLWDKIQVFQIPLPDIFSCRWLRWHCTIYLHAVWNDLVCFPKSERRNKLLQFFYFFFFRNLGNSVGLFSQKTGGLICLSVVTTLVTLKIFINFPRLSLVFSQKFRSYIALMLI